MIRRFTNKSKLTHKKASNCRIEEHKMKKCNFYICNNLKSLIFLFCVIFNKINESETLHCYRGKVTLISFLKNSDAFHKSVQEHKSNFKMKIAVCLCSTRPFKGNCLNIFLIRQAILGYTLYCFDLVLGCVQEDYK